MTEYRLELSSTAERQLRKLQPADRESLLPVITGLATDPRPRGSRKLQGYEDVFRIRKGTFRIIYSIEDDRLLVLILKIGHRRDIYRAHS
jgi:mRNA interferase RelE/StbE